MFSALHRTSIFVTDGKEWQIQRKAAVKAFSKKNFENHITQSLHHWLDILMRLLSHLAQDGIEFDFQELMGRFMFCLFLRIAFHEDDLAMEIMSDDPACLERVPDFVRSFDQATHRKIPSTSYHYQLMTDLFQLQYSTEEGVIRCGGSQKSYPERIKSRRTQPNCSIARLTD